MDRLVINSHAVTKQTPALEHFIYFIGNFKTLKTNSNFNINNDKHKNKNIHKHLHEIQQKYI
jgi:hypothetical protein